VTGASGKRLGSRLQRRLLPMLAMFLGLAAAWSAGLFVFAGQMPGPPDDETSVTDAIIVLTGGSLRLNEGFRLLAEERAKKLFVSGVYRGVEVEELLAHWREGRAEVTCCVVLGHSADNTLGNAAETAVWMAEQGYSSLRLVTADYHMQRSLFEFRRAMPHITIIPHPVHPENIKRDGWWHYLGTSRLIAGEFNKYLVARLRALVSAPPER